MTKQVQPKSDRALDDKPDCAHSPNAHTHADKLGDTRGKGRTGLQPGGPSEAEQMLDRQHLARSGERS